MHQRVNAKAFGRVAWFPLTFFKGKDGNGVSNGLVGKYVQNALRWTDENPQTAPGKKHECEAPKITVRKERPSFHLNSLGRIVPRQLRGVSRKFRAKK